ncbi:aldo/keto reductase [Streptomyces sp. NPDC048291]|uniref:aldo/keto reductase n=1 Tax=Streptomyces sp. NPDC048291 TaxID=3365530 RepID=UPI003711A3A3
MRSPLQLLDGLLDGPLDEKGTESVAHRLVLGGPFGAEPADVSAARLAHFADAGGLLVETSHSYAKGQAEEAIGPWLRRNPGTLGVATKVGHDVTGADIPLTRHTVHGHVRAALRSLGLETIDVLLYHCDDLDRPVAELADTLVSLVEAGYVRRVGASNWQAQRLSALATELAGRGHTPVASYQFGLAEPDPALLGGSLHADTAVLDVVRAHRLPLFAWSAQARGYFARTEPREVNGRPDPFDTEDNRARRRRCRELAGHLGTRPETVALAWSLRQAQVWPSIGPRTTDQVDRSLAARRVCLTDDQVRWLRHGR